MRSYQQRMCDTDSRNVLAILILCGEIHVNPLVLSFAQPLFIAEYTLMVRARQRNDTVHSRNSSPVASAIVAQVQTQRIQHLQQICKTIHVKPSRVASQYYLSDQFNFSLCRIPKVASTFWSQVFMILKEGASAASHIFSKFRTPLEHGISVTAKRTGSRFIFVARDPFSRLYSAYIDRIFLPSNSYRLAIEIAKEMGIYGSGTEICANDLTFDHFLNYIADSELHEKPLNMHWTPMFSLCNPCDVEIISVVKMESFTPDVHFTLQRAGISPDIRGAIDNELNQHRVERTVRGMVEGIIRSSYNAKNCMNPTEVARRIWVAFQVQGYINDNITFPFDIINTDLKASNHTFYSDVIMKTMQEYPLASEDSKLQRRQFLVNAYAGLSKTLLEKIVTIYQQDFLLYDYSDNPPA